MSKSGQGLLIVLLSLGTLGAFGVVAGDAPGRATIAETGGVTWQADLRSAHKVAVREHKPLLLVWGADWCGYCQKLEQETLTDAALAKYINNTFVCVHLDYDRDERVREILEIENLPCTILLTPDAEVLDRFEGFSRPNAYYKKLAAAQKLHSQLVTAGAEQSSVR